jgi:voltage-dependent anion channel protein 2
MIIELLFQVFGAIETKHKVKDYGLTISKKINTDNVFFSNVSVQDQLLKGLKLTIDASYAPQTGYVAFEVASKD